MQATKFKILCIGPWLEYFASTWSRSMIAFVEVELI